MREMDSGRGTGGGHGTDGGHGGREGREAEHPMIKPALRRGWRDRGTLRFGVTPAHAVVVGPLDGATESFLSLLDGTRAMPLLRKAAAGLGLGSDAADRLTGQLARAGAVEDARAHRAAAARVSGRLGPDLAWLSLRSRRPGAGLARLTARRSGWVQVRGAGRVGAALAVLLAQSGVGRVDVVDGGTVEPGDTSPGGIPAGQVGRRRDAAARAAVRAALPWGRGADPASRSGGEGARLVVLTPRDGVSAYVPDPVPAESLMAAGTPHLYAGVVEGTGFVGPLVVPGVTACAQCLLLGRAEREPGWPMLVGQWRNARGPGVPACDGALAATVAGLAAATALARLDGAGESEEAGRTEVVLPHLEVQRTPLAPHRECPCRAAAGSERRRPGPSLLGPGRAAG